MHRGSGRSATGAMG